MAAGSPEALHHAASIPPSDDARSAHRPQKRSLDIAERARRVLWKGGKESTQHESLRARGFPRYLARAAGCDVWDVDGNRYTDYLMSWGTVLLGHAHPEVDAAVLRQLALGAHFNLGTEEEVSLAERLVQIIPGAELVRFLATGAEATGAAVRIARAATGREMVLQYGFHGWLDWCQAAHPAGIPLATLAGTLAVPYNDLAALERAFRSHRHEIAAVIMEPVKDELPRDGFLSDVADLARRHGALLIFDEAKTGFRLGQGGAQALCGVAPDLSVFSKALANGYPLAVVAGHADVFRRASGAWVSGTYHGWPPSILAAHATMSVLEREPVAGHVWNLGERLMSGFNAVMAAYGLRARLGGLPPMPQLSRPDDEADITDRLISAMLERGYFLHPIRPWFISYAHDAARIDQTLSDLDSAAREVVSC